MNEIEWLDKVKKNFEYTEERPIPLNQLFRQAYEGVLFDAFVNMPNPFLQNLIPPVR